MNLKATCDFQYENSIIILCKTEYISKGIEMNINNKKVYDIYHLIYLFISILIDPVLLLFFQICNILNIVCYNCPIPIWAHFTSDN